MIAAICYFALIAFISYAVIDLCFTRLDRISLVHFRKLFDLLSHWPWRMFGGCTDRKLAVPLGSVFFTGASSRKCSTTGAALVLVSVGMSQSVSLPAHRRGFGY